MPRCTLANLEQNRGSKFILNSLIVVKEKARDVGLELLRSYLVLTLTAFAHQGFHILTVVN
jgi:hypothetical protein